MVKKEDVMNDNFCFEKSLMKNRSDVVVGLDEVGRGSLAGPVVAAAVFIRDFSIFKGLDIRDSKRMSEIKREKFYSSFINHPAIGWGIGSISHTEIDRVNILNATKMAMREALHNLEKKESLKARQLVIDGNFGLDTRLTEHSIIKGDETILSCKIASIIAKVFRDRYMVDCSKDYLEYRFDKNKGYGTRDQIEVIKRIGFCDIHRRSFSVKIL